MILVFRETVISIGYRPSVAGHTVQFVAEFFIIIKANANSRESPANREDRIAVVPDRSIWSMKPHRKKK